MCGSQSYPVSVWICLEQGAIIGPALSVYHTRANRSQHLKLDRVQCDPSHRIPSSSASKTALQSWGWSEANFASIKNSLHGEHEKKKTRISFENLDDTGNKIALMDALFTTMYNLLLWNGPHPDLPLETAKLRAKSPKTLWVGPLENAYKTVMCCSAGEMPHFRLVDAKGQGESFPLKVIGEKSGWDLGKTWQGRTISGRKDQYKIPPDSVLAWFQTNAIQTESSPIAPQPCFVSYVNMNCKNDQCSGKNTQKQEGNT